MEKKQSTIKNYNDKLAALEKLVKERQDKVEEMLHQEVTPISISIPEHLLFDKEKEDMIVRQERVFKKLTAEIDEFVSWVHAQVCKDKIIRNKLIDEIQSEVKLLNPAFEVQKCNIFLGQSLRLVRCRT